MPRRPSRLVAVVALLAFLAGNSYAISHARFGPSPCTAGADRLTCGCQHCEAEQVSAPSLMRLEALGSTPPSDGDDLPGPSCPCPGGCAYCRVAKVPGLSPVVAPAIVTPCLDDGLDETPRVYAPPFCGKLTRPPRF